ISVRGFYYLSTGRGGVVADGDGRQIRFDGSDILGLTVGPHGSYRYNLYFNGDNVGLSRPSEAIDAFCILPDGSLLISTAGKFSVPDVDGNAITGSGNDLLHFVPTYYLGSGFTEGYWELYLDGSAAGLDAQAGNIDAVGMLPDGGVLISTAGGVT